MKKLFLILCLSTTSINAMDEGEKLLNDLKTKAIPQLETALQQWQLAIEQHPLSTLKDLESAQQAVYAINAPRDDAQEIYQDVQTWLAPMDLLTLQPGNDNPHNKTVLALLSTFKTFKPQIEAQETKFQEYNKLIKDYASEKTKLEVLDVLGKQQEKYAKTANAMQAHLNGQKTKESFFEEHRDDNSMINSPDEFNIYAKYFTPDTHQIRNDIDADAFQKDWGELRSKCLHEWMANQEKIPLFEWAATQKAKVGTLKNRTLKNRRLKIRMPKVCPSNEGNL